MTPLEKMRAQREARKAALTALTEAAEAETRDLTADETAAFDAGLAEIRKIDERITELEALEEREARTAEKAAKVPASGVKVTSEPATYRSHGPHSFFRDVLAAKEGNHEARARLERNNKEVRETRAVDLNTTAGSGGEFAPPGWLIDQFVALARPGRVAADRLYHQPLPPGVSSINVPKVSGGSAVAVQAAQGNAVQDTAMTTTSVTSGVTTLGGSQSISLQEFYQSPINVDDMVIQDLAADYAKQLDIQVINGSGSSNQLTGLLNLSGISTVAYTSGTPAVGGSGALYAKMANAVSNVETARFMPADCILMHPRRYNWILASSDSNNRPLMVPSGPQFNGVGVAGEPVAQGPAGYMLGLPVYTDPNIPTNLGAGTNQDPVIVLRSQDSWLYESDFHADVLTQPQGVNLAVVIRVFAFAALLHRYAGSIAVVNGTGTVAPTF